MKLKKKLFWRLILLIFISTPSLSIENKIILKIDRDIITSQDLKNEAKYLRALNPKLMELADSEIFEISKNSLVREKIKKIEIFKNNNKPSINADFLKNIIENRYKSLGLNTRTEFINYLKNFDITIDTIENKIEIEALWNQLIYFKFSQNIKINKENLKKKIEVNQSLNKTEEFFLKEIVFNIDKSLNLNEKYNLIKKSISDTGFENTASLYSISDTAKTGGNVGWVNKNALSSKINNALSELDIKDHSKPITIPGGFIILQISDKRIIKGKLEVGKELKKMIDIETNKQLNQFSNIYFNKAKQEITIDEI